MSDSGSTQTIEPPTAQRRATGLGIVALFLANPFPEGGLSTSHRAAALLAPCQPQHSILTSMTAFRVG